MLATVIRSASLSSLDKGDPYYYFRLLDSMKLWTGCLRIDRLQVGSRGVLAIRVRRLGLKLSRPR